MVPRALPSSAHRWLAWLLPAALALGSLGAAAWLQMRPPAHGPLALIFPPWWSGPRAMLAAAPVGAIIRFGAWPSIVIVAPYQSGPGPGATGAWLSLDPRALGGCGATTVADHPRGGLT